MRRLLAIARREARAFFRSGMAPAVLTAFLALTGFFFTFFALGYSELSLSAMRSGRENPALNLTDGIFQPLVADMVIFLLFVLPAVAMRLFSEEYRSGRYDLIMTWPVPDRTWVLGKFLSVLAVGVALLVAASALLAVAAAFGRLEPGPLAAAGVGLLLATASIGAWGVFFSALVPYQVVAYILTFAFLLVLYAISGLEPHVGAGLRPLLLGVSFTEHCHRFGRGIVDSRDVFYHVALTGLGLAAATASLAGRRLGGARRWWRWAPVLALAALAVAGSALVARHPLSGDWTSNRRHSLAPQTVQVLEALDRDVTVRAFYAQLDPARQEIAGLLGAFRDRSPRLHYELADPARDLDLIERYGVREQRTVVVEAQGRRRTLPDPGESALINTVYRLVTGAQPVVYYVLGHGEHRLDSDDAAGYLRFAEALLDAGYDLRSLTTLGSAGVPSDAAVVVVAAPKTQPAPAEVEALAAFVRAGGAVLALLDPGTPPALAAWTELYDVRLGNDVVVSLPDERLQFSKDPRLVPVFDTYGDHPVTNGLDGRLTYFPHAQSLLPAHRTVPGVDARVILSTGPRSWAERDPAVAAGGAPSYDEGVDLAGPLAIGVALELAAAAASASGDSLRVPLAKTPEAPDDPVQRALWELERPEAAPPPGSVFRQGEQARLVIVGDSDFAANANLDLYGNRDLMLNALGWLAREPVLVALRARSVLTQPVVLSVRQKQLVSWGSSVVWPLLAGAGSLTLVLRQRRRR